MSWLVQALLTALLAILGAISGATAIDLERDSSRPTAWWVPLVALACLVIAGLVLGTVVWLVFL